MDMAPVERIAGAEHGGEAMAGAVAQALAQRFVDVLVGQAEAAAVGEKEGAYIKGVAVSVLAELCAKKAVARPAFKES